MTSIKEVDLFLSALKEKLQFHPIGIVFRPRNKNLDTIALLPIDCMSFHIAEYEINYPFKEKRNER